MLPPAPARFSTTTCWPRSSESAGAMMRAVVSVPPPGSKPTTVVTGLFGYWACAERAATPSAMAAAIVFIHILLSPLEDGLSLFHEGAPAFLVVLAREALLYPGLARGIVVLRLQHLGDHALRRAHR